VTTVGFLEGDTPPRTASHRVWTTLAVLMILILSLGVAPQSAHAATRVCAPHARCVSAAQTCCRARRARASCFARFRRDSTARPRSVASVEGEELPARRRSRNDAGATRVGDEVCVVAGSDMARGCRGGPNRHDDSRRRRVYLGVLIMIQNPVDARRGPSAVLSFVIAALFLLLALWSGLSGEAWALGLALVGALWVILAIRVLRRDRPSR
jgi:hypothetical protein